MQENKYSVILWDNDGVLVDTERLYFRATQEAFAGKGIGFSAEDYVQYFLKASRGTSKFAAQHGLSDSQTSALKERRNRLYEDFIANEEIIIPGVRDTLEMLEGKYKMGVVTGSPRDYFETIHERTGLLKYFDFVVARDDYAESKPSPEPYLEGIRRSGVSSDKCLAIEDSPRGLQSALGAQLDCWVIPSEFFEISEYSGADRTVDSVSDIPHLLSHRAIPN